MLVRLNRAPLGATRRDCFASGRINQIFTSTSGGDWVVGSHRVRVAISQNVAAVFLAV